jgi:hypothetical protein
MQVSNSETISIMEMKLFLKMLTDQEITINLRLNHDYRVINGTLEAVTRILILKHHDL